VRERHGLSKIWVPISSEICQMWHVSGFLEISQINFLFRHSNRGNAHYLLSLCLHIGMITLGCKVSSSGGGCR
jgi:hypothetical protein